MRAALRAVAARRLELASPPGLYFEDQRRLRMVGQGPKAGQMITQKLMSEIEACAQKLEAHPLMQRAFAGELAPATIVKYVSSIHYLIGHTPKHMGLACAASRARGDTACLRFFEIKREEERGHDAWAAADLEGLSRRFGLAVAPAPCRSVRALVAFLEGSIESDPKRYLAYILFAEYITVLVGPIWVRALETGCGVPSTSMSAVARHAELDRHHVADGVRELDALLVEGTDELPLLETLRGAMARFLEFCDELIGEEVTRVPPGVGEPRAA